MKKKSIKPSQEKGGKDSDKGKENVDSQSQPQKKVPENSRSPDGFFWREYILVNGELTKEKIYQKKKRGKKKPVKSDEGVDANIKKDMAKIGKKHGKCAKTFSSFIPYKAATEKKKCNDLSNLANSSTSSSSSSQVMILPAQQQKTVTPVEGNKFLLFNSKPSSPSSLPEFEFKEESLSDLLLERSQFDLS